MERTPEGRAGPHKRGIHHPSSNSAAFVIAFPLLTSFPFLWKCTFQLSPCPHEVCFFLMNSSSAPNSNVCPLRDARRRFLLRPSRCIELNVQCESHHARIRPTAPSKKPF